MKTSFFVTQLIDDETEIRVVSFFTILRKITKKSSLSKIKKAKLYWKSQVQKFDAEKMATIRVWVMLNGSVTNQSYQGTATCTIRCQAQKKRSQIVLGLLFGKMQSKHEKFLSMKMPKLQKLAILERWPRMTCQKRIWFFLTQLLWQQILGGCFYAPV